jgi:membrane peptidoglycan carboxypeptidase
MIRKALLALLAVVVIYGIYLAGRIVTERRRALARVNAIIAASDPADLTLSKRQAEILLRVEDPTFRSNKGLDFTTPGAGMTTISQSLAKHIFFDRFQPGFAKGELMALTRFALYPMVDKDRTLKAYLATAYYGRHNGRAVIGLGPAARAWFGKTLAALSEDEYLALVAMGPSPRTLDPVDHAVANADRVARMKRLLAYQCRPIGLRDVMLEGCA